MKLFVSLLFSNYKTLTGIVTFFLAALCNIFSAITLDIAR